MKYVLPILLILASCVASPAPQPNSPYKVGDKLKWRKGREVNTWSPMTVTRAYQRSGEVGTWSYDVYDADYNLAKPDSIYRKCNCADSAMIKFGVVDYEVERW